MHELPYTLAALLLVAINIVSAPAWADVSSRVSPGGNFEIVIEGPITDGMAGRFEQLTKAAPAKAYVILNSPGGRVAEALSIGTTISAKRMQTEIGSSGSCASACVFIWLAGKKRPIPHLDGKNRIGIHQISILTELGRVSSLADRDTGHAYDVLQHYLERIATSESDRVAFRNLLETMKMVDPDEILWISEEWLKKNCLLTGNAMFPWELARYGCQ